MGRKSMSRIILIFAAAAIPLVALGWFLFLLIQNPVDVLVESSKSSASAAGSSGKESVGAVVARNRVPRQFHGTHIGSDACRDCHSEISEKYATHPMSRSLALTNNASPLEDYTEHTRFRSIKSAFFTSILEYQIKRDETGVHHEELVFDEAGKQIGQLSLAAEYSVGSGRRGRSYLINHDGLLYMSPVTWYSHENCWDLSPAYSKDNQHFERRIVDGCVACHAGRTAWMPGSPDRFEKKPFHELSIGCERCHGPGETHVAVHKKSVAAGTVDEIINPGSFDPARMNALCFQCHLHGVGRVPHHGLNDFSFTPGDKLSDVWTILVEPSNSGTGEAATQGEQMMASKCFTGSKGQMTCIACHDPHSSPTPETQITFYNSRCQSCHEDSSSCSVPKAERIQKSPGDSCIQCHMPRSKASNVPHTALTDHRILRKPASDSKVKPGRRTLEVFDNEDGRISADETKRARAILAVRSAEASSNQSQASTAIEDLQSWVAQFPEDITAAEALGTAYTLVYDLDSARTVMETGLKHSPNSEHLLLRLTLLCHDNGDLKAGIDYGIRLLKVNPWHFEYHGRLAHMLGQDGRTQEGIPYALRAAELGPWDFQIHGWLAEAYTLLGDRAKSQHHQQLFDKLRPVNR